MLLGLSAAIALLAQAAETGQAAEAVAPAASADPSYGPTPPAAAKPTPTPSATKTAGGCQTAVPSADATEIVVCAERPQGYRLDPDVVAAKRGLRSDVRGKPTAHMKDTSCASIGPAGCMGGGGINLLGVALTAAEIASRLARGKSIGSMFVTSPEPTEYELYAAAKREREAAEAEAAAQAKSAAKAAVKVEAAVAPANSAAADTPIP